MQTSEDKGQAMCANGSAAHENGKEMKTREVAFEKNPSEPMVWARHKILFIYLHLLKHNHIIL